MRTRILLAVAALALVCTSTARAQTLVGGDIDTSTGNVIVTSATTSATIKGNAAATSAVATILDNATTQTTGKIVSFRTGGAEVAFIDPTGAPTFSGQITANGGLALGAGKSISFAAGSLSGAPTANGTDFSVGALTFTDNSTAASGTATIEAFNSIAQPTLAATNTSVTTTTAATLQLAGPPAKGTNDTATSSAALYIPAAAIGAQTAGYGAIINAPTGGTNNYSAVFPTGNVGIGTSSPTGSLLVVNGSFGLGGTSDSGTNTLDASTQTHTLNVANGTIATGQTETVNIATQATGTGITAVTLGSTNGASSMLLQAGTGNLALQGAAATNYTVGTTTHTGQINIGVSTSGDSINIANNAVTAAETVAIESGNAAAAQTLSLLNGVPTAGAQTLNVLSGAALGVAATANIVNGAGNTAAEAVNVMAGASAAGGTQTYSLSSGANAAATVVHIADGANSANTTITIGSGVNTGGVTSVSLGSGAAQANTTTIEAGTGNMTIGNSANARTWNVGAGAAVQTVNMFTGAAANLIKVGSTTGAAKASVATGTGGFVLNSSAPNFCTDGGANNATTCTITDAGGTNISVVTGMCVVVKLQHTLQAGANTFALNGQSGPPAIKSHFNSSNNLATAYAATGYEPLCWDGTEWLDQSE